MSLHDRTSTAAIPHQRTAPLAISKPLQIMGAFLLGAAILYGAGFAQTAAAHNAAHDMRHAQGFPCH